MTDDGRLPWTSRVTARGVRTLMVGQLHPWTSVLLACLVLYGWTATLAGDLVPDGLFARWTGPGVGSSFWMTENVPGPQFLGVLGYFGVVAVFVVALTFRAKEAAARLAAPSALLLTATVVGLTWSRFDRLAYVRVSPAVLVAIGVPSSGLALLLGAHRVVPRSTLLWLGTALAAVATFAAARSRPTPPTDIPDLLSIAGYVAPIPIVFAAAVGGRATFLRMTIVAVAVGTLAAAAPVWLGSSGKLERWLLLPWLTAPFLLAAARTALSMCAVPREHDSRPFSTSPEVGPCGGRNPGVAPRDAP